MSLIPCAALIILGIFDIPVAATDTIYDPTLAML